MKRAATWLVAIAPLALLATPLRAAIEGRMLLHMGIEFPLLFAAGWALARGLDARRPGWDRALAAWDAHGLAAAVWLSAVAALWMLPAALDAALIQPWVAAFKFAGWWLAGLWLASAWPRMPAGVALFFVGNLAWMFATAGLLYQSAEQRLCVNYLWDEQLASGRMLVGAALVMTAILLRRLVRAPQPAGAV